MRVWRHPLEYSEDVLTRKLLTDISDAEKVVEILDDDGYFMQDMEEMMCGYISKKFGNDSWQHVVQSRWLKIKQFGQDNEYDPATEEIPPIFVGQTAPAQTKVDQAQPSIIAESEVPQAIHAVEDPFNILNDDPFDDQPKQNLKTAKVIEEK